MKRGRNVIKIVSLIASNAILRRGLRLRNDLYCVGWGVKLYALTQKRIMFYVIV